MSTPTTATLIRVVFNTRAASPKHEIYEVVATSDEKVIKKGTRVSNRTLAEDYPTVLVKYDETRYATPIGNIYEY